MGSEGSIQECDVDDVRRTNLGGVVVLGVEEADDFAHRVPKLTLHALGRNPHRDQPVRLQERRDVYQQQPSCIRLIRRRQLGCIAQ